MFTLLRQGNTLANPAVQRGILAPTGRQKPFERALADCGLPALVATGRIEALQVNLGKLCNQTCRHCHVDAGPDRREIMNRETVASCLRVLEQADIPVLDITGGAPEMNPHFRWLVSEARRLGRHVIDRCNLTILQAPGYADLAAFLAGQHVEIIASLPCYLEENTDEQRGQGVFARSIAALRQLNRLGYAQPGSDLVLNLVYNPLGPTLPPPQAQLESAYQRHLWEHYGVVFTRLYALTNLPISRFLDDLVNLGMYEEYVETLIAAFNPATVPGVMCRSTLSVDWQGRLFDCDFNQMLELDLAPGLPRTIHEFDPVALATRLISTGQHCYGCTAGSGSSCQGALLNPIGE